jgi:voltage-gated potassium channel
MRLPAWLILLVLALVVCAREPVPREPHTLSATSGPSAELPDSSPAGAVAPARRGMARGWRRRDARRMRRPPSRRSVLAELRTRLATILLFVAGVTALGIAGYMLIEGWSAFDALYMTVITVASVGFGEVHPLSTAGRAFTMGLIVVGLGTVAYGLSSVTAFWVEGNLLHLWENRKMERRISELRDHIIVCGGGETGRHIAQELIKTRTPFVVIDIDPRQEGALHKAGKDLPYIIGDATEGEVLRGARIEAAQGLIACMPSDKDNLFTLLTARELNPRIRLVSSVSSDDARPKLVRAGADAVVSGKAIGALRLASEMVRPHVVSVLDSMLREPGAVRVQEIAVGPGSAGQSLAGLRLQERIGIIVFALRSAKTQRHHFNPAPETTLAAGDVLIACASNEQLDAARKVVAG